jgi:glyoxylate/hydroxypyruvate reductase
VNRVHVLIATPVEAELVTRLRTLDERLEIQFEPELLPPTRFPSDHRGVADFARPPADEERFRQLVEGAEVLYGIPGDTGAGLAWAVRIAPGLRFVQATAAGAGEQVGGAELTKAELDRVAISSASGVHAVPLAEWALLGLLAFTKDLPRLRRDAAARHWDHYPVDELRGKTVLIVGVGEIGGEVARLADAFGMRVLGVKRDIREPVPHVEAVHPPESIDDLVGQADAIVITLPLTAETRGLIGRETISRMREGAIVVNVGRGGVIDEEALIKALVSGKLAGAALDVFAEEPLPQTSPLWALENVIVSPHTSALSWHENERIIELFADNLRRYLSGEELRSRVRPSVYY